MPHAAPSTDDITALIETQMHLEGPLLPIFHAIQETYGFVPQEALPVIAQALNLTVAEVHGVMSFYHDFRKTPAGDVVVKICRAEACQSMGANALSAAVLDKLGLDWGGTTADGKLTVEPVYCLGLCACAPAAMVGGKLVARADLARLEKAMEGAA
ncbi:formate dehydrogenase subunit gamma [Citreicella sp. C3M06]|uniref:formate dehydrogenase subunit gamma n=1 Tax=Citreicella sp. C3M06 TaxID=2841564 RepID=UPI001C0A4F3F|nr:formate dehydrogenase subunit gamma [Citreicella sp. C3M06]MBU2961869.1 formate dehydrogenase subunit gamma [Citreicella sp. C3M06]